MEQGKNSSMKQHTCAALGLLMAASAGNAMAAPQTVQPSTLQSQEQRTERYYLQREQSQPQSPVPDPVAGTAATPASAPTGGDVRFVLREVRFAPSAFLTQEELQAAAAPYTGREVGMAELQQMLAEVNRRYAERGITTARAMLGGQAIRDGVLQVDLVEGRLGELHIEGEAQTRESFIRRRIHQQPGDVVDSTRLRDDLVYMNRTSDVQAQALLRPGAQVGHTDVVVHATEVERRYLDVFVDNAGIDSTGRERVGVQGFANGLAGINDRLSASFAYAEGGLEGQASYSGLVNRRNGRLGLSYSRSQINLVNGAYRDLDITGESQSMTLDFTQPFIANRTWLVSGLASAGRSESSTDIADERISDTESTVFTLGASATRRSPGREWTVTQVASRLRSEEPLLGSRNFTTAVGGFGYLQKLGQSPYLVRLSSGWQYSNDDVLPSGNLFQIGGVGSVRGYERGALSGQRGYFLDAELHRSFGETFDGYVFVDYGAVHSDFPRSQDIMGTGLGARWQRRWFSASVDVSHPLDEVLNDQDSVRVDFRLSARWQ